MERFKVKFVHGFHVAFDTENYENVQLFDLKKYAVVGVKEMNAAAN
jgi:hypothetical protein